MFASSALQPGGGGPLAGQGRAELTLWLQGMSSAAEQLSPPYQGASRAVPSPTTLLSMVLLLGSHILATDNHQTVTIHPCRFVLLVLDLMWCSVLRCS